MNEEIALSHPLEPLPSEAETQNITTALGQLVQHFGLGDYHQGLVKQVKDAFADPSQTLAAQLLPHIKDKSLADFALEKALAYHDYDWTAHYALKVMRRWNFLPRCCSLMPFKKGFILKS